MIKRRNFIWLAPLVLMVSFPLWRIPVGNFLTPRGGYDPAYAEINKDAHNFNMEEVVITETDEGRVTAIILADVARSTDNPNEFILEDVDADLFNIKREVTRVKANEGLFNTETELLTLTDKVVITKNKNQDRLYTDLLYYDDKKQTVHCPGKTKLKSPTAVVTGSSLDYDIEKGQMEMAGRVLCIIEEKEEEPVKEPVEEPEKETPEASVN